VEFDRIAIGVLDLALLASRPDLDIVAQGRADPTQSGDQRAEIVNVQDDPVPPAGALRRPSGIGREPELPGRSARLELESFVLEYAST
jgi:hypothetical protein